MRDFFGGKKKKESVSRSEKWMEGVSPRDRGVDLPGMRWFSTFVSLINRKVDRERRPPKPKKKKKHDLKRLLNHDS